MTGSRIDIDCQTVRTSDGVETVLKPAAQVVLSELAKRPGVTVRKSVLMDAAWPDTHVTENSLYQAIREIRSALGRDGAQILRSVAGRGYKLVLPDAANPIMRTSFRSPVHLATALIVTVFSLAMLWRWIGWDTEVSGIRTVAVVSFSNQTGDPRWDLLAQGLSQDLASDLARSEFIRVRVVEDDVISKPTDFSLSGSYQNERGQLRVRALLTEVQTGNVVWSHRWTGPESEVFDLQDAVAAGVSAALTSPWTGAIATNDLQAAQSRDTENLAAYELYLLGAFHKHRFTPQDYEIAADYLNKAITIDPEFAKAYSTLAVVTALMASNATHPDEVMQLAELRMHAIEMAARLAPNDPQTLVQLNWLNGWRGEFDRAEMVLRKAVELAPNNADVLAEAAWIGNWRGAIGIDSVEWADRAKSLHDAWPDWYAVGAGLSRFNIQDYDGTVSALAEAPNFIERHLYTAAAEALRGNLSAAFVARDRLLALAPRFNLETYMIARVIRQPEVAEPLLQGARLAGVPLHPDK